MTEEYFNATLVAPDWIPRYESAGFDVHISSIAPGGLRGNTLLTILNEASLLPYCGWRMLAQYLADRHLVGAMVGVAVLDGPDAVGTARYVAPTDLGTDGVGVWFSTPNTGSEYVRWYANGGQTIERVQDLATNRSATLVELGAVSGDVVQVCIVAGGVVGWWGKILIP